MFVGMEARLCRAFYHTPPLWTHNQFGMEQFDFPQLDLTTFAASPIPAKLRLGHKMEHVFEQLIGFSHDWKVLAKNLLVDEGKTRVGELDFILFNTTEHRCYHIELAYKFYVVDPTISEPIHRLMGPNKRDMFFTKLDKLREKQFPLLSHGTLVPKLEGLAVDNNEITQQPCFKAQLFLPYGNAQVGIRPLNKKCVVGHWVRFDDFDSIEFKEYEYYLPYKQEWVLPPEQERPYLSHFKTLLEVNLRMLKENAPMLWVKKPNGILEKLFVVWW